MTIKLSDSRVCYGQEGCRHEAKTAGKGDDLGLKIVARSSQRATEYDLMERVEAGMVLTGTEVKSLRNGRASLEDAYAEVDGLEKCGSRGCDIPEYVQGNRENHLPKPHTKSSCLLHRREIATPWQSKTGEKGITYWYLFRSTSKKGMAKIELSLARGRKTFDEARGDQETGRQARHRPRNAAPPGHLNFKSQSA